MNDLILMMYGQYILTNGKIGIFALDNLQLSAILKFLIYNRINTIGQIDLNYLKCLSVLSFIQFF